MKDILLVFQIVLALVLTALILMQVKGTGFGRVWGGISTSPTRRGLEGFVFKFTFVVSFLFILISALTIIV